MQKVSLETSGQKGVPLQVGVTYKLPVKKTRETAILVRRDSFRSLMMKSGSTNTTTSTKSEIEFLEIPVGTAACTHWNNSMMSGLWRSGLHRTPTQRYAVRNPMAANIIRPVHVLWNHTLMPKSLWRRRIKGSLEKYMAAVPVEMLAMAAWNSVSVAPVCRA
jgi:hypothetical protein